MASSTNDFQKLIEKSKEILIIIPCPANDDEICSAFGLSHLLEKIQKKPSIYLDKKLPQKLDFLKKPAKLVDSLSGIRDFVLVFNTKKNKILDIKTDSQEEEYVIRITPEKGSIDPRDFSFIPADFKFDLIIILGSPSLESLGSLYEKNTDLFFEVPKVNIDFKSANESYAQVNIVDLTACSVSQIVAEFSLENFEKSIDSDIAQSFLSGIISQTNSFQTPTTTPSAMIMAAKLMKYKADQPTIIRHLYKTKSLPFLKLWGRVMARLNHDQNLGLVWSLVSAEDFVQSHTSEDEIPFVLEQIQENYIEAKIYAILYSTDPSLTHVQISFSNEKIAQAALRLFDQPSNGSTLRLSLKNKNLIEAEKEILEKITTLNDQLFQK